MSCSSETERCVFRRHFSLSNGRILCDACCSPISYFIHLISTLLGYYHHHWLYLPIFLKNSSHHFFNSPSHYGIIHFSMYHLLSSALVPTFCVLYYIRYLFYKTYNKQCRLLRATLLTFFMPFRSTYNTAIQYNII